MILASIPAIDLAWRHRITELLLSTCLLLYSFYLLLPGTRASCFSLHADSFDPTALHHEERDQRGKRGNE